MKTAAFTALVLLFGLLLPVLPTNAGTQTWNPGGTGGGTGSWSGKNWGSAAAWVSGSTAVFQGGAGTVTVGTQTVGGLNFNTDGYTLSGGTLALAPANGSPFIYTTNVGSGTDTINATLTIAAGVQIMKTGAGTLVAGALTGGTAANPTVVTITGGTYSAASGYFGSVLSLNYGNTIGTAPGTATAQFVLDAGTLKFTGTNAIALPATRGVQVNAAGGAVIDGGGNEYDNLFANNAGASGSLYLSNPTGTISTYVGVISGAGSVTWNGPGTGNFRASNTYKGGTVVNKGTLALVGGSLGSNSLNLATGAVLSLQSAKFRFDLGNSADRLLIPTGTVTASGANDVRIATGNSLATGTYALITTTAGDLTGAFQFDGGSNLVVPAPNASLTIPAPSQIKNVGGTYYRLTLQNSAKVEQVVVTAAPAHLLNVMPLGSSSTQGVTADSAYNGGGYRSGLYQRLVNDGRLTPHFVGSSNVLSAGSAAYAYNVLTGANEIYHEGHSGYTAYDILENLNGNGGDGGNNGGYWLTTDPSKPGSLVNPDYVTLNIGNNDYAYDSSQTIGPVNRVDAIITLLQTLRPNAHVVVGNLLYRADVAWAGPLQNTWFNPRLPGVVFNHTLAGYDVSMVDSYGVLTPSDSLTYIGTDKIHPTQVGYDIYSNVWYDGIVYGSAYWTGAQDGQWSTVTAGNATNFAQDRVRTLDRSRVVDAATDVYFNGNAVALPTTLGQNLAVRSLNFTAGATGPVTVGGNNTLTLGIGGITVQNGTGTHLVSSNVVLGGNQTWGNVSSNALTVSGSVSGTGTLTLTNAGTLQVQTAPGANTTVTQSFAGPGGFVLSGANTFSGGTTVSSGTLVVNNTSGSGTGTGSVNVAAGAGLTNNGSVGGSLSLGGTANGNGVFGGAVTVSGGGVFNATGTVNGPLTVGGGGLIELAGGVLNANGGVVNNGTIRLERGARLVVGGGAFTNNGTLDVITGGFSAPGGFTNNGVVIDSSMVRVTSTTMSGGMVSLSVNGYSGHSYQLQRSDSLENAAYTNLGPLRSGTTGSVLTFTDNPVSPHGFYRVQVDP